MQTNNDGEVSNPEGSPIPYLSERQKESNAEPSISATFSQNSGRTVAVFVAATCLLFVISLIIVFIIRRHHKGDLVLSSYNEQESPIPVDAVIAHETENGEKLILPGEASAWFDTTIYARVNGYVASWNVDIGDRVNSGQVLANIETPELDAELAASRAQLKASQAHIGECRAELDYSKTTYERWRDSPIGVVSDQERESKKADFATAEAKMYAAEAQASLDQSKVDQYAALTAFRCVRAPFDGTITERKIDIGNLVTAGSGNATSPLYRISKTDKLRIFVDVPQSDIYDIKDGLPVEILSDRLKSKNVSGTISRTAESINSIARTMRVEIDIQNSNHQLFPGMYVDVLFHLPTHGTMEVPASALIYKNSGTQVAKIDSDYKVVFCDVSVFKDDGKNVQLSSGVSSGDCIVLNISNRILNGQQVIVNLIDPNQVK